jgi:hypothetical protein
MSTSGPELASPLPGQMSTSGSTFVSPVPHTHTESTGVTPRSGTWHRCEVRAWEHRELKATADELQRQIDSLHNTVAFVWFLLLCLPITAVVLYLLAGVTG